MDSLNLLSNRIRSFGIMSIIFTILFPFILIGYILSIVNIVYIATVDWQYEELNNSKNTFFVLALLLLIFLTPLASGIVAIIWASKVSSVRNSKV